MSFTLNTLSRGLSATLQALLPHFCPMCEGSSASLLCQYCLNTLPLIEHGCNICSLPLHCRSNTTCAECLAHPPHFHTALCAFEYHGQLAEAIRAFKDHKQSALAQPLTQKLIEQIEKHHGEAAQSMPDLLVPVPIHWRKYWQRSFNQSDVIANILSQHFAIPSIRAIKKTHAGVSQRRLDRKQRQRNLSSSFQTCPSKLHGKHVCLIDDVITTGATVDTLAQHGLESGATKVSVWALARTPKKT